jgi:release factor-specific protein-(glutamine-N5) methyltransferase
MRLDSIENPPRTYDALKTWLNGSLLSILPDPAQRQAERSWLLEAVCHISPEDWYRAKPDSPLPLSPEQWRQLYSVVQQRTHDRLPMAYLLGTQAFYGREFMVTPQVLIPRPETELLVDEVIHWVKRHPDASQLLDLGTGSGCLAVTLALEVPTLNVTASDISAAALDVTQRNAKCFGVQLTLVESDWFTHLPRQRFDVIVTNPPYIPYTDAATLSPEVLSEPHSALFCRNPVELGVEIVQHSLPYLKIRVCWCSKQGNIVLLVLPIDCKPCRAYLLTTCVL